MSFHCSKRHMDCLVLPVSTVAISFVLCIVLHAESAVAKTDQEILVRPITSNGEKIGCFAVDVQSKTAPILWENKENTTAITFKSHDLGLPSSGKAQAVVRLSDHIDQHNLNIVKGIITVALNKVHFEDFKSGGVIELGNKKIRYKDISAQYNQALICKSK